MNSAFLGEEESVRGPGAYGKPDCYEVVRYRVDKVARFLVGIGVEWCVADRFLAQGVNDHSIVRARRAQ